MLDRQSGTRLLTSSYCPADRGVPLIEEPVGTVLLRAARVYGDAVALIDGQVDRRARALDLQRTGR